MTIALIANPSAGGRKGARIISQVENRLRRNGIGYRIYNRKGSFQLNPKAVQVTIGPAIPFPVCAQMKPEQLRDHVRGIMADMAG